MKYVLALAFFTSVLILSGCGKKNAVGAVQAPTSATSQSGTAPPGDTAPQSATASAPAEPSPDDVEKARKLALLDFAAMEDQYMNDPHAQWASSASASSTFGDDNGATPSDSNLPSNVIGPVDGKSWTNNRQDVGFDWLQVGFAKPVFATEIRVVFVSGQGVEAVTKLEVQDDQNQWVTVWSGLSDVKADSRGERSWFVRKFDKTKAPTKAVKITLANNVQRGYKVVDAVQLVGE
jgi:hypothetical protein